MSVWDRLKLSASIRQQAEVRATPPAAADRLQQKRQVASGEIGQYRQYAEINRICAMPLMAPMDEQELEAYQRESVLAGALETGFRLFPIQCEAVASYETLGGLFAPIGVGCGKTGISLLIASRAYSKGIQKILLLIPSQVLYQLTQVDIRWARARIPIPYPIHILGGRSLSERQALARSGKKGLYIMPYSLASAKDASTVLEAIRPQLIIADEAHNLANPTAARMRRVRGYVEKYEPQFVALSGTITSKTIHDYYHLIKWALKDHNPLPNSSTLATEWAAIIDANATDGTDYSLSHSTAGPLLPLVQWAKQHFPEQQFTESLSGFRKAYKQRLVTAPGVVATAGSSIGTSLILCNRPIAEPEQCSGYDKQQELVRKVNELWLTPNGDEIEHAIHTWKWLYELSAGFYNELSWPAPEVLAERRRISLAQAQELLEKALQHHAAEQDYYRALRKWLLEKSKPGVDTPMLVGKSMALDGTKVVGEELYGLWIFWKGLDFEGRPERDSRAVRVCDWKIRAALNWIKGEKPAGGAIFWVHHQEMGQWLYEELLAAHGPEKVLHCPAGAQANKEILDPENAGRFIVASMAAHGTGKNLQHFHNQYFLQWPRPATLAEQTLGRTHRTGQKADELLVYTNNTGEFDEANFAACLNDSLYIHQTTGNKQKLIYAAYDPTPKIFPSAVLHERGFQSKLLNKDQERVLTDKFGGMA